MNTKREQLLSALSAWVAQRPGLDLGNYGDVGTYRSDMRRITRQRHDFNTLLAAVSWRESIDADALRAAFKDAYSGRLTLVERPDGAVGLDYCTGQYWPTEYRAAACAVLASALWAYWRGCCPDDEAARRGLSPGSWIRCTARREMGAPLARRWFDWDDRSAADWRVFNRAAA